VSTCPSSELSQSKPSSEYDRYCEPATQGDRKYKHLLWIDIEDSAVGSESHLKSPLEQIRYTDLDSSPLLHVFNRKAKSRSKRSFDEKETVVITEID
jgi:hypothetical protein